MADAAYAAGPALTGAPLFDRPRPFLENDTPIVVCGSHLGPFVICVFAPQVCPFLCVSHDNLIWGPLFAHQLGPPGLRCRKKLSINDTQAHDGYSKIYLLNQYKFLLKSRSLVFRHLVLSLTCFFQSFVIPHFHILPLNFHTIPHSPPIYLACQGKYLNHIVNNLNCKSHCSNQQLFDSSTFNQHT